LKIAILAVRDTGGTAFTLAHAVNNVYPDEHKAVSVRGVNNFINYPTIMDMNEYDRKSIRNLAYQADVLIFLGAIKPFYDAFNFQKSKLKDAKKILLCMGSEWRWGREELKKQTRELLGADSKIVLGGADMFMPLEFTHPQTGETIAFPAVDEDEIGYLPVVRSFKDIAQYSLCNQDEAALKAFIMPQKKIVFTHAPTSETNKGSETFYRVATKVMQQVPEMTFNTIRSRPWVTTLAYLSKSDVLFDQAPPFPTAYGALSVEAGIFKVPSFSRVDPWCAAFIKRHSGLDTPYISFKDEEDLEEKVLTLAQSEKHRETFGQMNYDYCKQLHDEKPVVDRLLKLVEAM
jgi:hypothetical protein